MVEQLLVGHRKTGEVLLPKNDIGGSALGGCNEDCEDAENLVGHGSRTAGRHDRVDFYSFVIGSNRGS